MEAIISRNRYPRRRVALTCGESLTDQSYKKQCDINLIMKQYEKTGMLPQQTTIPPRFVDNTQVPDLMTAFEVTNNAIEAFKTLPPEVRRAMDNNPANIELFISDNKNYEFLKNHGIIIETPIPEKETTLKDVVSALKETKLKAE